MAHKKDQQFRVAKISILKALARKPKGMLRQTLIHKNKTVYSRRKQKENLVKIKKEGLE